MALLCSGLNDDTWHHVVVVVDERSLRLSASVDRGQRKSAAVLRRCATEAPTDDDDARPLLITLAVRATSPHRDTRTDDDDTRPLLITLAGRSQCTGIFIHAR